MTTTGSIHELRENNRCGICRQKGIFHCEHDTPYRDIYLGVFDPTAPRNILINTEKPKVSRGAQNNSASHGGENANQPANLNATGQLHHGKKSRKPVATKKAPANTSEQNKEKKGCTIL
ncbi:unnamed protein product [Rotaria socialis]|uniref:Uncharacterized protein n=1 Tax=Rotaria socialis TaxID=392032 RepID=A0A820UG32_9BILA|nr:unnamed protein product [Rotaria socialis]CAF4486673.1 unnamed protein product [Rotaria socialis]